MTNSHAPLRRPRAHANLSLRPRQSYNVPSPNEMVVDTDDYVGVANDPEKDPVAIINPDQLEQDADQLQDLPLATDRGLPKYLSPVPAVVSLLTATLLR